MNVYVRMLAEKAAQGDQKAKQEGLKAFMFNMASIVRLDKADQIAEAFGIPFEEQQSYASEALEHMNKLPDMKPFADEIRQHYRL